MKATALGLLALASVLFAGSLSAVAVGEMGPDFKFDKSWNTIEGATKLSDYRGKVVLIEAWATW
ncbi:hypothetical protein PLCT2_02336 [Planctomycetaceae bacterium]|jgi:hypothetical protein|nr:hypothetical protein PLCT2_02336 [Planctomycetaceae bacterium]